MDWNRLPKRIKMYLDKGERLSSSPRTELVHFMIDEIHIDNTPYPRTNQLTVSAANTGARYLRSLKDKIDGQMVGTG